MTIRKIFTTYTWRIDNFSEKIAIVQMGGSISSDVFCLNGNSKAKFSMKIKSQGWNFCDTYLICNDFGRKDNMYLYVICWHENSNGESGNKRGRKVRFSNSSNIDLLSANYSFSSIKQRCTNDILFVSCQIQHREADNEFYEIDSEDDQEDSIARREFSQNSFALHSDGHFDLTIKVGDKEFKAFKCMFMGCSEVFRRMLSCPNSIEANTGVIQMENTKPEVIDALIRWIYQVKVDNMNQIAMDLYKVADKYEIAALKKKCTKLMIKSVSRENVLPYLIFAYKHDEETLKQNIIGFLRKDIKNLEHLVASDEWLNFRSEDSEEVKEIVADVFK